VQWGLPEVFQCFVIDDCQIHNRSVAVVEVGTRELFEILLDHLRLAFILIKVHAGNRSEMDVRVDEARNQKLSFSRNHRCAGKLLPIFFSLYADNAPVFDEHAAPLDVIEILRRDDGDVSNQNLARGLI